MSGTPAPLRRTPLALATALVLVAGTLALGVAGASATGAVRKYSPTLTPNTSCVAPGSVNRFTATITNSSSSNQPLGSALFRSNAASGFRNIAFRSFTKPVASGGQVWQALPDIVHGAGIYLRAANASQSLPPGDSVTVDLPGEGAFLPGRQDLGHEGMAEHPVPVRQLLTGHGSVRPRGDGRYRLRHRDAAVERRHGDRPRRHRTASPVGQHPLR